MNIVKPYAKLLMIDGSGLGMEDGIKALRKVEWIGRISHRSEDKQGDSTWPRFIQSIVLDHGDWSIVEHTNATVDFLVDRGITHELVRHRLFSFTQESTRFVNYEKKMPASFVCPFATPTETSTQEEIELYGEWEYLICKMAEVYRDLLVHGASPQIARSVFPNALASRIIVTGNLRNWRHFFIMRTTKETHPQMREVTIPLLEEFKANIPLLYDDIEPLMKQSESMKRAR